MVHQLGCLWPCPQILRPALEWVTKDKCSSLLGLIVSDEGKNIYNIDTLAQCYETFYRVNLLQFHGHTVILCYKAALPW
jgi:hypothetical protein